MQLELGLRCDNGKEYMNAKFFDFSRDNGFRIQNSPPYTPQLNGVAERYNQTIMDRARCLLDEAQISKCYWPEVVKSAAYIGNRVLANTMEKKTPFELLYGNKPSINNLVLYGSLCYVRIPDEKRSDKFSQKGIQGKIIGYDDMGYRVLVDGSVAVTRNEQIIDGNASRIVYLEEESNGATRERTEPKLPALETEKSESEDKTETATY